MKPSAWSTEYISKEKRRISGRETEENRRIKSGKSLNPAVERVHSVDE
jgi:hypothetical protein